MSSTRNSCIAVERRLDRRHHLPVLEIVIGDERFCAVNWSLRGALVYGFCDVVGTRVRGEIGVPGSSEGMPFAATVVRADLDTGTSAICFEDARTERIEFHEQRGAALRQ